MAKHTKAGWLWAGALAGALALGTACSATEAPVQLAQATPSTPPPGQGGSGVPEPDTSAPGTTTPVPGTTTTPQGTTTIPGTTTTAPGTSTTAPGTSTTAPGTGLGGSGTGTGTTGVTGTDAGVGMGGSGVGTGTTPGLNPNPSDSTSTFQPPTGSSVLDGGTGF